MNDYVFKKKNDVEHEEPYYVIEYNGIEICFILWDNNAKEYYMSFILHYRIYPNILKHIIEFCDALTKQERGMDF